MVGKSQRKRQPCRYEGRPDTKLDVSERCENVNFSRVGQGKDYLTVLGKNKDEPPTSIITGDFLTS